MASEDPSKDVALLEQVLMRLAAADDSQLQKQITNLLVPVLAKLGSSNEDVRKKVKTITHFYILP